MIGSANGHSAGDKLAAVGLHSTIEYNQAFGLFFACRDDCDKFIARLDAALKMKILRGNSRSRARQLPIEQARQQRFGADGLCVHVIL